MSELVKDIDGGILEGVSMDVVGEVKCKLLTCQSSEGNGIKQHTFLNFDA
jgi:hypothetical protein